MIPSNRRAFFAALAAPIAAGCAASTEPAPSEPTATAEAQALATVPASAEAMSLGIAEWKIFVSGTTMRAVGHGVDGTIVTDMTIDNSETEVTVKVGADTMRMDHTGKVLENTVTSPEVAQRLRAMSDDLKAFQEANPNAIPYDCGSAIAWADIWCGIGVASCIGPWGALTCLAGATQCVQSALQAYGCL